MSLSKRTAQFYACSRYEKGRIRTEAWFREGNKNLEQIGTRANQDGAWHAWFGVPSLDFCSRNHQALSVAEGNDLSQNKQRDPAGGYWLLTWYPQ